MSRLLIIGCGGVAQVAPVSNSLKGRGFSL